MILTKNKILDGTKIHTIIIDKKNRWKKENKINHWLHNPRNINKNPHEFKKDVCTCTKTFEIEYSKNNIMVVIDGTHFYNHLLNIDKGMFFLARNNGFDSVQEFFKWFDKNFSGKIIHWTNKIY